MKIQDTEIEDTFAEAFGMRFTRIIVTAHDDYWLRQAIAEFTGYASSVIGCDLEAGLESELSGDETPDGRPGASLLAFAFSSESLATAVTNRVGQCIMTCPSTAVFDGFAEIGVEADVVPPEDPVSGLDRTKPVATRLRPLEYFPLGKHLRFFGDGYQKSKVLGTRRYWRIPVMDGEFVCEEKAGVAKGIAGGNFILQTRELADALAAARRAVEAIATIHGAITPFPGGAVRSGSKVGARYQGLKASTAEVFCPTLRGRVTSRLHPLANAAIEIVIDGVDREAVGAAMATGIRSACGPETVAISAGNYGGKLGPHHFHLHALLRT